MDNRPNPTLRAMVTVTSMISEAPRAGESVVLALGERFELACGKTEFSNGGSGERRSWAPTIGALRRL